MRALNGVLPIVVSVGVISAVTAILWRLNSTAAGSYHLIYVYLFPERWRHRKNGALIDPSPWCATNAGEKVRG